MNLFPLIMCSRFYYGFSWSCMYWWLNTIYVSRYCAAVFRHELREMSARWELDSAGETPENLCSNRLRHLHSHVQPLRMTSVYHPQCLLLHTAEHLDVKEPDTELLETRTEGGTKIHDLLMQICQMFLQRYHCQFVFFEFSALAPTLLLFSSSQTKTCCQWKHKNAFYPFKERWTSQWFETALIILLKAKSTSEGEDRTN